MIRNRWDKRFTLLRTLMPANGRFHPTANVEFEKMLRILHVQFLNLLKWSMHSVRRDHPRQAFELLSPPLDSLPGHSNELLRDGSELGMGHCLQEAKARSLGLHTPLSAQPRAQCGGVSRRPVWLCHQQPPCQWPLVHTQGRRETGHGTGFGKL